MEENKLTFEESLSRLQEIVSKLENNDIELQKAFSLFEEGLGLVEKCEMELREFDDSMQQLLIKHEKVGKKDE
ncbi:MAG: exodeoxyribonuclease VII small subunit [Erysipelotrichaceae bacterium]|nr:exodeoxyribonuclease VII small subunit [Erysipelotrichaceae bacterium]MBQ9987009.1 exodeoxyribonuclease VII small subunit [Erysipelotrichales bacterium]MBR3694434.1 exodeoxyribonuclease VII small subunit [Erysipelotrichales bacterium]